MMAKILIVDDEEEIVRLIGRYAQREGYETAEASDGSEAVELCRKYDFDMIIMDVMMRDMDGYTAVKKIRSEKDIPVLMLSARGTEYDKLFGFEVGVDDYVTKPFSPKELMARVNVILKRQTKNGAANVSDINKMEKLVFGGLEIDMSGRSVSIDGERAELTLKEYDLLTYLARNRGIALSRDQILDGVWGYDSFGDERTVDWQIKLLRSKLGKHRDHIRTVRGVGYKFEA